jgi:hypothetical protein
MSGIMTLMAGPKQRDQDVGIRQTAIHSSSQRARPFVMAAHNASACPP